MADKKRILLASYWRSGSSWIGGLLEKTPNTFYIFEPLQFSNLFPEHDVDYHIGHKEFFLQRYYYCGIPNLFMRHWDFFRALYKHPGCGRNCTNVREISEICSKSDVILMKTVRVFLHEVENLLNKPSLRNLKVIFLMRDPRGTMNSLDRDSEAEEMAKAKDDLCPTLRENMLFYPALKALFPSQVYFLRYEDLARNSIEKSKDIWSFLSENETDIPYSWIKYLEESMSRKVENPASKIGFLATEDKSSTDWQLWRETISEELLIQAEFECEDVISKLGYRLFKTLEQTRDKNLSVFTREDCISIPCI